MRIISEFHDFYDGVQAHGQDTGMNYVRKPVEEELGAKWPFPWIIPFSERSFRIKNHVIGFCGKLYPCLRLYTLSNGLADKDAFCYNLEEVDAFIMPLLKKKELQVYENEEKWYCGFHVAQRRKQYRAYFDAFDKIADKQQWRFEQNLSPVFVASLKGRAYAGYGYKGQESQPDRADPGQKIVWNGSLREFEFVRVKDPYTAFQEISMYLGNMAFPNKPIPKLDDVTMAEIKGFNKFSFRKDKAI